jgi:hypothetical protein
MRVVFSLVNIANAALGAHGMAPRLMWDVRPLLVTLLVLGTACGDSSGPGGGPRPAGLIVAGGQNAAFPDDTFPLTTWFTDSNGTPLGTRPSGVSWTNSAPTVVRWISDSLFVARALGTGTLTAEVSFEGKTFTASREFHVIPPLTGRLAWVRQAEMGGPVHLVTRDLRGHTVVSAPAFGHPQAPHGPPALSPDGRYVAIQAARPTSEAADIAVYVVDLELKTATSLTDSMPGNQIAPRWLPDGQTVVFSSDAGGSWNIWSVPAGGGQPRLRVRLDAGWPVFFDVSASDGRLVIALVTAEGGSDLWEASIDTGLVRRITDTPDEGKAPPRLSPDGRIIAYNGRLDPAGTFGPFLIPRGGGLPRPVLPSITIPVFGSGPARADPAVAAANGWSEDGGFLLITWNVDATATYTSVEVQQILYPNDVYAVSVDGQYRVRMTTWVWADVQPTLR